MFKYLHATETTPEGLCFEAIQKYITESNKGLDSFFINFSDGQPYFTSEEVYYSGKPAEKHTRQQVQKMREKGITVMSYFIGGNMLSDKGAFERMYGRDARFIDVDEIIPLARSINQMFSGRLV